ncbi:flagellar protein flag, putative [Heliomicrobium modesticaldum Ice1]|uniref:Flagellar protein flag, putative n=1 Tax=Heliobacterium modesticaldum (strain ATCC 51547 / Ice1) TaxID=498761 RepID=B0TH34_HELMI|nr:flagellar protein FlaG [Heliomicrobium modesticaldum]ABZ83359.1 flagellar protein flag, putative [Heliomicrobium modesticaldum Ice1]
MELAGIKAMDGNYIAPSRERVSQAEVGLSRTSPAAVIPESESEPALSSPKTAAGNEKETLIDLVARESFFRFSKDAVIRMMQETNAFLLAINTDIRLQWHEEMEQFSVQVYDQRNNRVLREFPPQEFLDTMAKLREYVGILLDKKV